MPRRKKNGRGGGWASDMPRQAPQTFIDTIFQPFAGKARTMQEEVRNTRRHQDFWDTDQRLRYIPIKFISAGTFDSKVLLESKQPETPATEEADRRESLATPGRASDSSPATPSEQQTQPDSSTDQLFFVDQSGGPPVQTGLPQPQVRAASPTPSNSSDEIIVFRGRQDCSTSERTLNDKIRVIEDQIHMRERELETAARIAATASQQRPKVGTPQERHKASGRKTARVDEDDAILNDYIQNMREQGLMPEKPGHNNRDLGGFEGDIWQETDESTPAAAPDGPRSRPRSRSRWNKSDLEDFDSLSTSDGVRGVIQAILSKRSRKSGAQYLVVWDDDPVDDARWIAESTLHECNCQEMIQKFEEEEAEIAEMPESDTESDDASDSDVERLRRDVIEVEIDGDAEEEEDAKGLSDETIARLLAKQEELGYGSHELFLYDGMDGNRSNDDFEESDDFMSLKSKSRRATRSRAKDDFPNATRLADAYDGFDVMDFERPSLKTKPKGRRGKPHFDISDPELEESMEQTWERDRERKKERKMQREELRSQGLLGSKNGKANMKEKYREGMSFEQIKDEIAVFLRSDNTTLALPPMDKKFRKSVHELALFFNLKSKSVGSGKQRFPVLTRTSRTKPYSANLFAAAESKYQRRFYPRMDAGASKGPSRRGGAIAGVTYRDGEVVGASAPEIGVDNIGRAMLEKMGWSTGMGLGALNNKGILQPVSHVVKTTKAGLG